MAVANPYELQRQRIKQDSASSSQGQNDALKRRFAAMGGLNSGSYLKAQERLSSEQDKNTQRAMEGVDVQESLAAEQRAEAERGRQFSREERLGGQSFMAGENALGRRFATSEREAGQAFSAGESDKQRGFLSGESALARAFAKSEREAGQDFSAGQASEARKFADEQRKAGEGYQAWAMNEQRRFQNEDNVWNRDFAERQFKEEKEINAFNQAIAQKAGEKSSLEAWQPWNDTKGLLVSGGAWGQAIQEGMKRWGRR